MPVTLAHAFTTRRPSERQGSQSLAELPIGAQLVIVTTTFVAAVGAISQIRTLQSDSPGMFLGLLMASVALAASKVRLPLLPSSATLSLSYCTNFAALALLHPFQAALVVAAGAWSQCVLNASGEAPAYRTVFSIANVVLSTQLAALAAGGAGGYRDADAMALVGPTLAAATAFFFANTVLMAMAVGQSSGTSMWSLWREQFLWSAPVCFIGAFVGSGIAYVFANAQGIVAILSLPPLYLVYMSYRSYLTRVEDQQRHLGEVSALHLASVEALARAIGARDQTLEASRMASDTHVRRVQLLAVSLARTAGMSDNDVKGVEVAALLHDIGKLAVPEHILTKPGRLTEDEFSVIRMHPSVGAEIIRAVPFPYPVAPLIESHHERWDGSGYPRGLSGSAIPLGARILSIVDYFDALIADRPYHKAISEDEALTIILGEGGKALDPDLVTKFAQILRDQPTASTVPASAGAMATDAPAIGLPATGLAASDAPSQEGVQSALENITRANQEMRALYEVAEAMGTRLSLADTMALVASKLTPLVPASSWALFLHDDTADVCRCTFATGLDAERLQQISVPFGTGTIGWLARGSQPIVNARPAADFEAAKLPADTSLRSMIAFPLTVRNRFIGALAAYHVEPEHFTPTHQRILDRVAPQAAKVVQDALTFEHVRNLSVTDPLTGLANTRGFKSSFDRELPKADRYDTKRALLVIDVDRFKLINDLYGHDVGDRALQAIARTLERSIRPYDICGRNGGDEFVVLLTECDAPPAAQRALEIQQAVAAIRFEVAPGELAPLAISVGTALYPDDGLDYEALLKKADRRMYADKSARKAPRPAERDELHVLVAR
jgi:diguanylate cyclase (GGDEF)-like protein/putative nucleotidyltransferase with HDIG domain